MAFHDFTSSWAGVFSFSGKQQATKTEPQAVAKQEVNLRQSANSLQTVTQKKVMF